MAIYVCMYVGNKHYTHVCITVCIYECMYSCVCICAIPMYTLRFVYRKTYISVHKQTCIYVHTYTYYIHAGIHACVCMDVYKIYMYVGRHTWV